MKYAIQKFTAPTTQKPLSVNLLDIFAVYPNDGSIPTGNTYDGAGAVLVSNAGFYLPVKEEAGAVTELWLGGLRNMTGSA